MRPSCRYVLKSTSRIVGLTDEDRRTYKANLMTISLDEVRAAAATYLDPANAHSGIAVVSGKEHLEAANSQLDRPLVLNSI